MVAFKRSPPVQCGQAVVEPVGVDRQRIAVTQAVGDLSWPQPQPEGLMLEIEHSHDAAVGLASSAIA